MTPGQPEPFLHRAVLVGRKAGGDEVAALPIAVDGSDDAVAGAGQRAGTVDDRPDVEVKSARAMSVGERYSEYTPWGFNGAYYYVRLGYRWGS